MKNFLLSAIVALIPAFGFSQTLLETEVSIRPLQPGLSVGLGVLGSEIKLNINGAEIIEKAIFITGEKATAIVNHANAALTAAGEVAHYTFDASKQMIVITGKGAAELLNKSAQTGLDLATSGIKLADASAHAILIETTKLANASAKLAEKALVDAYTLTKNGAKKAIAQVKIVTAETAATAKDAAVIAYNGLVKAVNASKNLAIEGADTAIVLSKTAVILVNDTGAYVFNHTKNVLIQIGKWGQNGVEFISEGVEVVLKSATSILKTIYSKLPKVSVSISWGA